MFCKSCGRAASREPALLRWVWRRCQTVEQRVRQRHSPNNSRAKLRLDRLMPGKASSYSPRAPSADYRNRSPLFDDRRAIQVGIVFAIVYEVAILLGALIIKSKTEAMLGGIAPGRPTDGRTDRRPVVQGALSRAGPIRQPGRRVRPGARDLPR